MNGKSIKQIAAELHISKQALWQRMKRHQQILDMMPEHSYIIKRSVFVDEALENSIKALYNNGDGIKNVYDVNANDIDDIDDVVVNNGDNINITERIDGIKTSTELITTTVLTTISSTKMSRKLTISTILTVLTTIKSTTLTAIMMLMSTS